MVAEAERGGRVAAAVHHLRQGGAGIGRRMALADKRYREWIDRLKAETYIKVY